MASKTSMPEVKPTFDLQEKLRQDLYREIFKHSPEPIAIITCRAFTWNRMPPTPSCWVIQTMN